MASLTIRNIEDTLKASLRIRAAEHGRSMEEEVRQILRSSLARERTSVGLGSRIASRFSAVGGVELPVVARSLPRPSPGFGTEEELELKHRAGYRDRPVGEQEFSVGFTTATSVRRHKK